jgi:tetratricopeptide (TPR) repeat protein
MQSTYTVQEAQKIVGVPLSAIRRFISHGFVVPTRGLRREYRFSFRDLVVLRLAKALADASVSPRRIGTSLKHLRRQLPAALPLTGLRISAVGNDVIVAERDTQWRVHDGQYLLALEVTQSRGCLSFAPPQPAREIDDWFAHAFSLEEADPSQAMESYARAIAEDPSSSGAYANLGRLMHEAGRIAEAQDVYARGEKACPDDPILLFNYALLQEDQNRFEEAIRLYKRALVRDPRMTDAHYNLGLLYQTLQRERDALRHLSAYRKLSADSGSKD